MSDGILPIIAARHSVRKYKPDPVPKELLDKLLLNAQMAPNAMGKNPWKFHVITTPEMLTKLGEISKKPHYNAPVVVFTTIPAGKGCPGYEVYDCALAHENMCLAAAHHGLGSVILAYNYPSDATPAVKQLLGIPADEWICPCDVAIGVPADAPAPRNRKVDSQYH